MKIDEIQTLIAKVVTNDVTADEIEKVKIFIEQHPETKCILWKCTKPGNVYKQ